MESPYDCYLRLPDVLALQRPRTAEKYSAQWADEHFFIIVHQSAEVLASQALVDLRALRQVAPDDAHRTLAYVRRVAAVIGLLEQHLALLEHLPPESFAGFRPLLDDASAGQSSQFAELFAAITECTRAAAPAGIEDTGSLTNVTGGGELAQAWWRLRSAVSLWRTRHLLLVEWMIGDQPGTGGTSGLAYLRSRIDLPPHHTAESTDDHGRG